jgi:hypothetical protein
MDTKEIKIQFDCLVALSPRQWQQVFDILGSKFEELSGEAECVYLTGERAWAKDERNNKALSEIYGALADHFFALRDK